MAGFGVLKFDQVADFVILQDWFSVIAIWKYRFTGCELIVVFTMYAIALCRSCRFSSPCLSGF